VRQAWPLPLVRRLVRRLLAPLSRPGLLERWLRLGPPASP